MPRNYNPSASVYVSMAVGAASYKYGFRCRLDSSHYEALGITLLNTLDSPVGIVFGCNSPKPFRATKKSTTGTESSFISTANITTAKAAGWKVQSSRVRGNRLAGKAVSYYVTINGIKYGYYLTKMPGDTPFPSLTATGATAAGADDALFYGCSFPKPPKGRLDVSGKGFSTFIAPTKIEDAAAADWEIMDAGTYSLAQLEKFF